MPGPVKITITDDKGVTRVYKCPNGTVTITADNKWKTFTGHRVSPGTEETTEGDMRINEDHVVDQKTEPTT